MVGSTGEVLATDKLVCYYVMFLKRAVNACQPVLIFIKFDCSLVYDSNFGISQSSWKKKDLVRKHKVRQN